MSFSSDVKKELSQLTDGGKHCKTAELAAVITLCQGVTVLVSDRLALRIHTENKYVALESERLLREVFAITAQTGIRLYAKSRVYCVAVTGHADTQQVLRACSLICDGPSGELIDVGEQLSLAENSILRRNCCRRAYLKGAFLAAGAISDPRRFYHFEIACPSMEKAQLLQDICAQFDLDARIIPRKSQYVLYLKEGTQIVDVLGVMGAVRSLMDLENIRILREISNDVNRRVNCETANIGRTVDAAMRQIQDIEYIRDKAGLSSLPEPLRQMAQIRLENMDLSLKDLGAMMDPPIGKSGVNHRLAKLSSIAQKLREKENEIVP